MSLAGTSWERSFASCTSVASFASLAGTAINSCNSIHSINLKEVHMPLSQRLAEYIRAAFTGIWIQSHEHEDALAEIARLCQAQNWALAVWDIDRGLILTRNHQGEGGKGGEDRSRENPASSNTSDPLAAIRSIN